MHWIEKPGASVETSRHSTLRISQELLSIPGFTRLDRTSVAQKSQMKWWVELYRALDQLGQQRGLRADGRTHPRCGIRLSWCVS